MAKSKIYRKVPSKKRERTAQRIIKAIEESHGLITVIAEKAGVERHTVTRYINDFPSVAKALEDSQERLYDFTESKIYEKIQGGDITMLIFFAKTRMKHRGYVERQEIDIPSEIKINVKFPPK